jgi:phosphohistidine phosphatase
MSGLAFALAGPESNSDAVEELTTKYPTSAIAVLTTQMPWPHLGLGGASLVDFHVPR